MSANAALATAKRPDSIAAQLTPLAGISTAADRLLAKHPNAPATLLELLSRSKDRTTRKSVAVHPNAPKAVLLALATQFPGDFYRNPAFDWLLLEEPDLLFGLGHGVLKNILKRPDCPPSFMAWAVDKGDDDQKLAVAMNPQASEDQLRRLVAHGGGPADAARWHQSLQHPAEVPDPIRVLEREVKAALAVLTIEDAKALWRRGAIGPAQWIWLSSEVRMAVPGRDGWCIPSQVCLGTTARVDIAPAERAAVSKTDQLMHEALATSSPNLIDVLEILAADRSGPVRARAAKNTATPSSALRRLAQDEDAQVRLAVAENPAAPAPLLEVLVFDTDAGVRKAVARNPATPESGLEALARDPEFWVRIKVARNCSASLNLLAGLAIDSEPLVRGAVGGNGSTPTATLESLAHDADVHVRRNVAGNPAASSEILKGLALDPDVLIRAAVAANVALPMELLHRLSQDGEQTRHGGAVVKVAVAKNPSTPPELLRWLARDENQSWFGAPVREAVATNPLTPTAALLDLSRDKVKDVLVAAARNPSTPIEALVNLAAEKNLRVRAALAENPAAPLEVLQKLARIKEAKVMTGLARNPACPPSVVQMSAALRWRHDLIKLAKTLPGDAAAKLPSLPQDESLIGLFVNECRLVMSQPQLSIVARLVGADNGDVMALDGEQCRSAARSSIRAVRLRGLHHRKADPVELVKSYGSIDWTERLAIAGNPAAPSNVIEALAKDSNRLVALQAQATGIVRSAEAAAKADLLAAPLLQFDCVPLATEVCKRLRELDPPMLKQLVGTPWWGQLRLQQRNGWDRISYGWLAWRFKHAQVLSGLSEADQSHLLQALAKDLEGTVPWYALDAPSPITAEVLGTLAADSREDVRQSVAGFTHTPAQALRLLVKDKSDRVRCTVAQNPATPVEALEALSKMANSDLRGAVAENSSAPLPVLERLAQDKDTYVRRAVASNASAPMALREAVLEQLAVDADTSVRVWVASHATTPSSVRLTLLERLAIESDGWSRQVAARNTATPVAMLLRLALDTDPFVRGAVAGNPGAPAVALEKLAGDSSEDVRKAVAANPSTPPTLLSTLSIDAAAEVRWAIACGKHVPLALRQTVLENVADPGHARERRRAAQNEAASAALLDRLALDKDCDVLLAVAQNPATPPESVRLALESLAASKHLEFVASHPATPVAVLEKLGLGTEEPVLAAVACNAVTPLAVRERLCLALSVSEDANVRLQVAENTATPAPALIELAMNDFWVIRFCALHNPSLPADRRDQGMADLTQEIHKALGPAPCIGPDQFSAEDFTSPLAVLELLPQEDDRKAVARAAKSKDWLQRAATALCEGVTVGELRRMLDDEVDVIKQLGLIQLKAREVS